MCVCVCLQLSCCVIDVGDKQAERVQWTAHDVAPSSHFLEYIPGRDQLWTCEALKAGAPSSCRAVLCCAGCCRVLHRQPGLRQCVLLGYITCLRTVDDG